MCKPTVITKKGDISVTQCLNCKMVNVWNRSVLLSFSFEQFYAFIKATQNLPFDEYLEHTPDGTEVVILATPYPDLSLVFTRAEWYEFFTSINEAAFMQQVYQLVHN